MTGTGPAGNIYLIGFSFTGKTTVGRLLAHRLGMFFVDSDDEIERAVGRPISEIFEPDGETHFRELETELLRELSNQSGRVISTGGGIVVDPTNRELMDGSGTVVCLEARPVTILERLQRASDNESSRPLLQRTRPLDAIRRLKSRRQRHYAEANVTVHTDFLQPDGVVEAIVGLLRSDTPTLIPIGEANDPDLAYSVETETASYPIVVGAGALDSLGERMRTLGLSGSAHIIVDGAIESSVGRQAADAVQKSGYRTRMYALTPGEASKTLVMAGELYSWLVEGKAERRDIIVAVGGGVVGDLAGFVAATYARGLTFIQVPTTVLAMADASIGGKVAVDLPAGKNLVGAFYQPALVLADVKVLSTLPERDRAAGWAEVVKTGLIMDEDLVSFLEGNISGFLGGDEAVARRALARCAALKGRVVSLDERETSGLRATLNYGHTLGHAIETVTGYSNVFHGEAVAIGMSFAGILAANIGRLSRPDLERQQRLISRLGLPIRPPEGLDLNAVRDAMKLDKKVESGANRWVLLDRVGHAQLRSDVDQTAADEMLEVFFGST